MEIGAMQWLGRAQRYLLAGALTVVPLWITWLIFTLVLTQLSRFGSPWVRAIANATHEYAPAFSELLLHAWFQPALAVCVTLAALYLLGWIATRVAGKRLIDLFDRLMHRIPMVQTIYGATRKLVAALQQKPEKVKRVVLIEFPAPHMKTIGFVTRVLRDEHTGQELAAVYVPTTPNPTSGYLEIVPVDRLVSTDWTMDQAMSFIISGGAVAPDRIAYSRSSSGAEPAPSAAGQTPGTEPEPGA